MVRLASLLALLAGGLAMPAHAAVLDAEDVLPPGQSGHVSVAGVAASAPDLPFFDRGPWNQSVALGR